MGVDSRSAPAWHGRWRQLGYMALLISVWYLFSYLFNASLKAWFRATRQPEDNTMLPVLLTVFLSNTVAASIWVLQLTGCLARPWAALHGLSWFSQLVASAGLRLDLGLMCSAGAVGIAAACIVLQHGSIQLVQVLRSMGPMFTALWAYLILDQTTRGRALLCLLIALAGTALASWREPSFSALTFCLMLTVNTTLTFRNAVTKRVLKLAAGGGAQLTPYSPKAPHNFAHSPATSTTSTASTTSTTASEPAAPSAAGEACRAAFQAPEVISCMLLALTNAVGLGAVAVLWGAGAAWNASRPEADGLPMQLVAGMSLPGSAWPLLAWMGTCSFMYNMASQIVLAHVHVVSHGMLELFKRVFVLIAASLLLGDVDWAWHNAMGAGLATLGTMLYFTSAHPHGPHGSSGARGASGLPPLHPGHTFGKALGGSGGAGDAESQPLLSASQVHSGTQGSPGHGVSGTAHRAVGYALPGGGDGQCMVVKASPPVVDSVRKRLLGPPVAGGGLAAVGASRRLRLAYVAMLLVLLASPTQFLESVGVSSLTPSWLREYGPGGVSTEGSWEGSDMVGAVTGQPGGSIVAGLGSAGQAGSNPVTGGVKQQLPQPGGQGHGVDNVAQGNAWSQDAQLTSSGSGSSSSGAGGGGGGSRSLISPGNFLLSGGTATALKDLSLPPPDARLYAPRTIGQQELLKGGPLHRGLLPFHRTLERKAAAGAGGGAACAQGGTVAAGGAGAAGQRGTRRLAAASGLAAGALALPRSLQQSLAISTNAGASSRADSSVSGASAASAADPSQQGGLVGVYAGWLDQDNLGDEIVADLFLDLLAASVTQSTGPSTCVSMERASPELLERGWRGCKVLDNGACDFAVMGGGSTVYVDYVKRIAGAINASKPTMLFGSGFQSGLLAKRSNEKYLKILCQAKLLGGVRGSYTQGHLAKYGCSGSNAVRIIRDSAILSDPLYGTGVTALRPQLRKWSEGKRHVVVVTPKNSTSTSRTFASAIRTLLATGSFAVVLQGVDPESTEFNQVYARALNANLPPGAPPVVTHDEYQDWAAVLDLYRHASASLNARLHSGVLSVSALRPTLYVASNVKYRDFMSSLGLRAQLVDPTRKRHLEAGPQYFGEYLAALLVDAVRQTSSIQGKVQMQQAESYDLYKAAMAELLERLEQQDPGRFHATLRCCQHISITRSTPHDKRVLIRLQCTQPGLNSPGAPECKL